MLTGLEWYNSNVYALSKSMPVNFSESSSWSRSTTVTIPDLVRVTSVTVNTGSVSYSVNGNNVAINVSNGSPASSYTSSQYVSSVSSHTGSTEPPSTYYYSSGGYSGTLSLYNKVNNKGTIPVKVSKTFSESHDNTGTTYYTKNGTYKSSTYSWDNTSDHPSVPINQDGYIGDISRISVSIISGPTRTTSSDGSYSIATTYRGYYEGTLTKTVDVPYDDYWGYYSGYIYGSTTYYYAYNVTINYVTNVSPSINIVTPVQDQIFSETVSSFVPIISVSDPDGDTLTCKLFIDTESIPRDTKTTSNTATAQNVSFNAQNIGLLTEGEHKMNFVVNDGEVTTQKEIGFKIDKTPPTAGSVAFTSTDTSISISGTATDSTAIHAIPYSYAIGSSVSQWTTVASHTFTNLTPNTKYTAKFMARDKAGHITEVSQGIYTKASKPSLSVGNAGETGLIIKMTDTNPSYTEYLVSSGSQYITAQGTLSQSPEWIKPSGKSILVNGLVPNTQYTFTAKARSIDGSDTVVSNQATGNTLASPPQLLRFDNIQQNSVKISWDAIDGATGYDIEVDSVIKENGLAVSYLVTGLLPETTHTYRVRVRNAGGTGNWSSPFSCTTLMNKPGIPQNIEFTAEKTEITLLWDTVVKADGYDIEADGVVQDNGVNRTYTHYGLVPYSQHKYRVRAKNAGGAGEWSAYINAATLPNPPAPPSSVNSEIAKTEIILSWEPMPKTDRYEVEVDGTIYDAGLDIAYLHQGLTPLTTHQYRIRGINAGGTGEWSSYIYLTTHPYEPAIPENVMASSDGDSISLSWYMASFAWTYEVEIDSTRIEEVTGAKFEHNGLVAGSHHTYRIRSRNISGTSDWTSPISITASSQQVSQDMTVTNLAAVVTYDTVTLSWDSVAADSQYEVEADGVLVDNGFNAIYNHAQLKPGTYHEYKIRVKSDEANEWSSVLNLSTLPIPPGAPVITKSYATNKSIQIWWNPVKDAVSYDVEADGVVIKGITNVTYLHDQLISGTSHQYRVRARTLVDISPWSEVLVKSTGVTTYKIDCTAGEIFDFSLLARNVQDFKGVTFVVTYNSDQIEIEDLFGGTPQKDLTADGQIPETNIIVKYVPGRVEFSVNGSIVPGTGWSGEITDIVFKAKETCTTEINFNEE